MIIAVKTFKFSLILLVGWLCLAPGVRAADAKCGILVENTNVRDSAGYTKVIKVLSKGAQVSIASESGDWYQITLSGTTTKAWVAKWLVGSVSSSSISASVASTSALIMQSEVNELSGVMSIDEINKYWQGKINALRKAKGLRELVIDRRLIRTATEWSKYLGQCNQATHSRPDGKSAQQWIASRDVRFTKRGSDNGWKNNYFAENLGLKLYVRPTVSDIQAAMDAILKNYLKEGPGGSHYRSVYHPDWNSFGAGLMPVKNNKGTYSLYFVFHYGSLAL